MVRTAISTSAPLYTTGASYYPVDSTLTTLTGAVPTNAWFENLIVGTGTQPIALFPYQVKVNTQGIDICVPNMNTSGSTAVLATMLQNFSFRATTTAAQPKVTAFTDLGCTVTWTNGMSTRLVRGMAYVAMTYAAATPVLNTQNAITSVNGVAAGPTGSYTGTKFKMALNNGQTWILYSTSSVTLNLTGSSTLTASAVFTGTMKLALLPSGGSEATLDTYSAGLVTGGTVDYTVSGNTATQVFTWSGTGPYLIYALPHHQAWLTSPTYPTGLTINTLRGSMRGVTAAATWSLAIPLPVVSWNNTNAIAAGRLSAVTAALAVDRSFVPVVQDPYFGGKQLAKAARLALIADQLGDTTSRDLLLNNLKPIMNAYLTGAALRYDTVWGGVVSAAGLGSQDADFGNGRYNDHIFHYGYVIYAAAVIAKFDGTWLTTYQTRVNDLVRDIANPSTTDTYFPTFRQFDWFESHSWASGNFEFGDNRNSESTSEGVNAYYALYLWGVASSQTQITTIGRVLMAQEIDAAQRYWQIRQSDTTYPQPFRANGVVGIVWSTKVDYATWFGAQAEYIFGIQMLPITPATEALIPAAWITEVWTNNLLPLWTRSSVWRAQLLNGGSGYVPAQFSPTGQGFTNGLIATGGTGTGLGFNVNITGGAIDSVYIIFNQHGTAYTDGDVITLNGSGGSGAQVRVFTQPEDGWKAVLLGAHSQTAADDAWTRTLALSSFDDGSSKTQALVHIASQTPDTGVTLTGAAASTSTTSGALGMTGSPSSVSLTGSAQSISTTTGAAALIGGQGTLSLSGAVRSTSTTHGALTGPPPPVIPAGGVRYISVTPTFDLPADVQAVLDARVAAQIQAAIDAL
jgi:endo-1,3(4)-beta-glucanase